LVGAFFVGAFLAAGLLAATFLAAPFIKKVCQELPSIYLYNSL
jgi:hypothetical protein